MNPATPPEPTSAYEWVGGESAGRTLVDRFYDLRSEEHTSELQSH